MTIDEAIKHAREIASQKLAEYNNRYDNNTHYRPIQCKKCAEEHEQLAKWLEELKELREGSRTLSFGEGCFITEDNLDKSIDNAYFKGYSKAVDDTIKAIKEEYAFTILEEEKIDEIAEQLEREKQNEDFKQKEIVKAGTKWE